MYAHEGNLLAITAYPAAIIIQTGSFPWEEMPPLSSASADSNHGSETSASCPRQPNKVICPSHKKVRAATRHSVYNGPTVHVEPETTLGYRGYFGGGCKFS